MASHDSPDYDLIDRLVEEFAARYRRGERPSLQEYLERYPDLADDLRELLPAQAEIEQVREDVRAPSGEGGPAEAPSAVRRQLGDYLILREIGHGGMGVVYEAEQLSLGRHVALKVLPAHARGDTRRQRRFAREARAAARLHHSNIVPVFGVGEHEGTPYYVMQFIQGLGLDEVLVELRLLQQGGAPTEAAGSRRVGQADLSAADLARSLVSGDLGTLPRETADDPPESGAGPGGPGASPPAPPADPVPPSSSSVVLPGQSGAARPVKKPTYWQSVAQVGVQVADALEYAHKQGVLHRDIKPSNLLLDTDGTVWVTDFGLAKAEGQENLTHTGDLLGTLRYLPPEAFEGRADARGDVYSLGLTLYELLAFRPAFDERDRNRLVKQVTTAEPPRLDRLNPAVPRDLVTVVHKAIDRDPARRYASAADLGADLRRFIDDEPVQARRVRWPERLRRWGRHNPVVAGLSAAVALLLLVVAAGSLGLAYRFRLMARREQQAAEKERQARAEADGLRGRAEDDARRLNDSNRFLAAGRRAAEQGQWAEAAADLGRAVALRPDNALARGERANLYLGLGLWKEAAPDYFRQAELLPPDEDVRLWGREAVVRLAVGDTDGYRRTCARMLGRYGGTADADTAATVAVTCALGPDAVADPAQLVRLARPAVADDPEAPWYLHGLGLAQYRAGDFDGAAKSLRAAMAGGRWGPADSLNGPALALALHRLGRTDEARKALDHVDSWLDQQLGDSPRETVTAPPLGLWWEWARLQILYREAAAAVRGPQASDHPAVWVARGRAHAALRQWDEAADDYARAVDLRPGDPWLWVARARFHADRGQWDQAEAHFTKAVQARPDHPPVLLARSRFYAERGRDDRAEADLTRAIELRPRDAALRRERGRLYARQGRWDKVADDFITAVQLLPADEAATSERSRAYAELVQWDEAFAEAARRRPGDARLWVERGRALARQGRWDSARTAYAHLINNRPPSDWFEFACVQLLAGDAEGYRRTCRSMVKRFGNNPDPFTAYNLARTCMLAPGGADDPAQAVRWAEQCVASSSRPAAWSLHVLAAAHYRAGHFEEASRRAGESRHESWDAHFQNGVLQALIEHRLGQDEEAGRSFEEASRWLDRAARDAEKDPAAFPGGQPVNWLEFQILFREAKALIDVPQRRQAGECLARGEWQEAVRLLDPVIAADPTHRPDRVARGRALAGLGRWDEAAADFAAALELLPDGPDQGFHYSASSRLCHELLRWDAVFARVVELRPEDGRPWTARARFHAARREFDQAVADYARGVRSRPLDDSVWLEYAAALLLAGDGEGYRQTCADLIERYGRTEDARTAHLLARVCVLGPQADGDAARLVPWAKPLAASRTGEAWPLHALGAAHYRAGQFQQAVDRLGRSIEAKQDWPGNVMNWGFLALAHARLGEAAEARQWLGKLDQWLDRADQEIRSQGPAFPRAVYPADWLIARVLRREAEELMSGKQTEPGR